MAVQKNMDARNFGVAARLLDELLSRKGLPDQANLELRRKKCDEVRASPMTGGSGKKANAEIGETGGRNACANVHLPDLHIARVCRRRSLSELHARLFLLLPGTPCA